LLGELEEAVSRLSDSPRFDFLRNLIVAEFTASRKKTTLQGVTLGELSERLRSNRSLGNEVRELSPEDQRSLLRSISELGGIEPLPPHEPPPERQPRIHSDSPVLSSVEAERRLSDAITALKNSPRFHLLKLSRLGDFWEAGWPRAPFEEALTLQQIAEMKVAVMLEKRSFGGAKILHVVRALERAVGEPHRGDAPPMISVVKSESPAQVTPAPQNAPVFWHAGGAKLPAHAVAILKYIENLAAAPRQQRVLFGALIARLPEILTATEAAVVWFRQESDNDIVASLLHLSPAATSEHYAAANLKVAALFRETAPSESRSWLLALQSPGISLEELLGVYPEAELPPEAVAALARIVLGALGASHPLVFGESLERYYTLNPEGAELLIKRLIGSFPQSEDVVLREIKVVLPFMRFEDLQPRLLTHATFRERDRMWLPKN
jgi:hypothetical protein